MRYLVVFLAKCLQVFVVLLCVLAHLFLGWQFVILVGHLGQERLVRATLKLRWSENAKHYHWGVKPYDLRYSLFSCGLISGQAYYIEWRPVTTEMWTVYTGDQARDDIQRVDD